MALLLRTLLVAILALTSAVAQATAPEASILPSPAQLFGCPLDEDPSAFVPPAPWSGQRIDELGVTLRLPTDWKVTRRGPVATATSPDGQTTLEVRRQRLGGRPGLAMVRDLLEVRETGPSHAGTLCSDNVTAHLNTGRSWLHAEVGVYGRPLGERRRTYSLFGARPSDVVVILVTTRWRARDPGPDLSLVRRLLGSVRPASSGELAGLAL